MGKRNIFN